MRAAFRPRTIAAVADDLDRLEGGRFAGVTTFPALLFEPEDGAYGPTPNLATLARSVEALHKAGRHDIEVNAPGTTSSATISRAGRSWRDPVRAGPWPDRHLSPARGSRLPEVPAVCYVTEVSHLHAGRAYCFGGGLYIDPVFPITKSVLSWGVGQKPQPVCSAR